jgi:hypothetical protein
MLKVLRSEFINIKIIMLVSTMLIMYHFDIIQVVSK